MRCLNAEEFIRKIKRIIKHKKAKRIAIITDKDGTLLLNYELRQALTEISRSDLDIKIYLIANSGRTIGDFEESLKRKNIPINCFDYIIGDNGCICKEVRSGQELFKHTLDPLNTNQIIEVFKEMGGDISNIRLTDGEYIIAYDNEDARKYYRGNENVIFITDFDNINCDITKLTITGSYECIKKIYDYISENIQGIQIHEGATRYPTGNANNCRIDITGNYNKGTASRVLIDILGIERCIYLGNDLNDISMFLQGIENNDFIAIASHREPKITRTLIQLLDKRMYQIRQSDANVLMLNTENVNSILTQLNVILTARKRRIKIKAPKCIAPTKSNNNQIQRIRRANRHQEERTH